MGNRCRLKPPSKWCRADCECDEKRQAPVLSQDRKRRIRSWLVGRAGPVGICRRQASPIRDGRLTRTRRSTGSGNSIATSPMVPTISVASWSLSLLSRSCTMCRLCQKEPGRLAVFWCQLQTYVI
ncbi:hypothetical protein IF1G_07825 [Cordyceps javanica]|uniref:Uncharacterized protein n=1 Tax=Cordyceps javanica TaxID=43265 RepID=A0A545UUV3_9HYPO|nr:hypothetical protein IF1G_07825 [Cordyceps javanica]